MSMEDLYEQMKVVLALFGLRFGEMEKVRVTVEESCIRFAYENKAFTLYFRGPSNER